MVKAKEVEQLDCEAEALDGIRRVLRTRLGEMSDLRAAALDWGDIEGVHSMRVASRRLRSALRDFEDFLGDKGLQQRRLKKVADALGEVRDHDVAIKALEQAGAKTRGVVADGIGQLVSERAALRERTRAQLERVIAEEPLAELRERFLTRLEKVRTPGAKSATSRGRARHRGKPVSFKETGRAVIEARVAELRSLGDSLHHPFKIKPLHRMRITAKRLRYALELFAPCWGGALSAFSHEVAKLQTALGDLRDCDIWIADLGARLDRCRDDAAGADAQTRSRQAAVWLLHHYTKERGKHFRHSLAHWHKWETSGFFERLLASLDETGAASPAPAPPSRGARAAPAGEAETQAAETQTA